jgi:hypothetical protein
MAIATMKETQYEEHDNSKDRLSGNGDTHYRVVLRSLHLVFVLATSERQTQRALFPLKPARLVPVQSPAADEERVGKHRPPERESEHADDEPREFAEQPGAFQPTSSHD